MTPKQQLALDLIQEHPDWPKSRLGRELYRRHVVQFPNENAAYKYVMQCLGVNGKHNRKGALAEALKVYKMPESQAKPFLPYDVKGENKVLVLSDIHVPYHVKEAVDAALDYGAKLKPTIILFNGDIIDFHKGSNFEQDPEARNIPEEIADLRELLRYIKKRFPKARIIYKVGNHEERWTRFWRNKALEMYGMDFTRFRYVLGDDSIELVEDKRIIQVGKLPILHGHEFPKGMTSPVNPARGAYLRASSTVLVGHSHKTSNHTATNLLDKTTGCWSTGCLCDLHPGWSPFQQWNHGFAFVTVAKDGNFHVDNRTILAGKVV